MPGKRLIIGADPGLSGALALAAVNGRRLVSVEFIDAPVKVIKPSSAGKSFNLIDAESLFWELASCLRLVPGKYEPSAWVEQVSAMPGQGVSTTFAFGRALGALEAVLATLSIPTNYVRPSVWKKAAGLPASKHASLERARQVLTEAGLERNLSDLDLVMHNGRAEALLIALYGARKEDKK